MRLAWRTLGLGLLAITAAACEDGLEFCTNRDDAGQCPEIPDFPFDGGMDATTPPSDARADAAPTDASVTDAAITMDAATDASTDAAAPVTYGVEEFCAAVYAGGRAWRDELADCCIAQAAGDRAEFLTSALAYTDSAGGDSADRCASALATQVGANLEFSGAAAVTCAAKYASQFAAPPAGLCAATGIQIDVQASTLGKQSQDLVQIPECRSALVGKLALNAVCVGDFQCQAGLRCLGGSTGKNCRDPLGNGAACSRSAECADGLVCVGVASGTGRTCRPKAEPVAVTAPCTNSIECDQGLFCDANGTCKMPTTRVICSQ